MKITIRKPNGKRAECKHLLGQKISMSLETKVGCHKYLTLPVSRSSLSGYAAKFESVLNTKSNSSFLSFQNTFFIFILPWIISAGLAIGYQYL